MYQYILRHLSFLFFFCFSFFISYHTTYALSSCPGVPRTLTWTVTGAYTSCDTHIVVAGGSDKCSFDGGAPPNNTKPVTLAIGESYTVQFQCQNNGGYSTIAQDSLGTHTGAALGTYSCCGKGDYTSSPYFDGNTCTPYTDTYCQNVVGYGASGRIINAIAGTCGCLLGTHLESGVCVEDTAPCDGGVGY